MSTRKGSALLIVLGMLSFMVVSAVGFSMFMRQSRLPSSYLRRNVASRYLVKAALANAIEELDGGWMSLYDIGEGDGSSDSDHSTGRFFGIYDDPYPGCGRDSSRSNMQSGQRVIEKLRPEGQEKKYTYCENGDFWFKRVFCPFGTLPTPDDETDAADWAAPTVPTLTLEALAYLPPAIIDDVRKISRATRTAQWRSLPYEAGRYAYTAVNVSDLFDINRLRAGEPRDSGINRVTLASLCATDPSDLLSVDENRATQLDDLLSQPEKQKIGGQVVPFVSLADFAVSAAGSAFSPFSKYIGSGNSYILQNDATVGNAMFITDSWFPKVMSSSGDFATLDLADCQPFKNYDASDLLSIITSQNAGECPYVHNGSPATVKAKDVYEKNLGPATIALYDYLDGNRQPSSLAFPTVEAVPMIVAVGAPGLLKPEIEPVDNGSKSVQRTIGNYQYNVERKLTKYVLKSFGNRIVVQAAAMYPFRRMAKTVRNGNYQIRGVLRLYLSPDSEFMGRPTRPMGLALRTGLKDALEADAGAKSYSAGVASFACDAPQMVPFSSDNETQKEHQNWIKDVTLTFNTDGIDIPIIQHVEETWSPVKNDPDDPTPPITKKPVDTFMGMGVSSDQALLSYVTDSGAPIEDGKWANLNPQQLNADISEPGTTDGENIDGITAAKVDRKDLQLYAAVWLQIVEGSGPGAKVYDMVPACGEDDELFLGATVPPDPTLGGACPLLNFRCAYPALEINADLGKTLTGTAEWYEDRKALFVADPRYNHSPENWFYRTDGNVGLADKWCDALDVDKQSGEVFGVDGRDRDVFMFVSDQEYLQSVGEFQFLPALRNLDGTGKMIDDTAYAAGNSCDGRAYYKLEKGKVTASDLANGGTAGPFPDGDLFWRTYTAYNNGTGDYDENIYKLPCNGMKFQLVPGTDSYKVNPYSDDSRVLSAAMMGTPFDYYVASTNNDQRQDGAKKNDIRDRITTLKQMEDYSFCENCALAKITKENMADLQDGLWRELNEQATKGTIDWGSAWSKLSWQSVGAENVGDDNKILFGDVSLDSPLYGVDRKFLYSYWRECFDNRQQLFLIFVRAEPTSIGGGAAGNISSAQLGGRAVALVWRDPQPIADGTTRQQRPGGTLDADNFRQNYKNQCAPHRTRVLFYHQFD